MNSMDISTNNTINEVRNTKSIKQDDIDIDMNTMDISTNNSINEVRNSKSNRLEKLFSKVSGGNFRF